MSGRSEFLRQTRLLSRVGRTGFRHVFSEARLAMAGNVRGPRSVLLILGCQRSGTTLMTELLEADPRAKVYPEHSILSAPDRKNLLRLGPLSAVARRVSASRHSIVVLKPLVESQRTLDLLDEIDRSRGIWMFRHWRDVARSNLARFGEDNGIHNLRCVVEQRAGDWRGEGSDPEVREVVNSLYEPNMSRYDAAALFWWVRNSLFFSQNLHHEERIRMCRYEELVMDPSLELKRVYEHLGLPSGRIPSSLHVSRSSVGRGSTIDVSAEIAQRCDEMEAKLQSVHEGAKR